MAAESNLETDVIDLIHECRGSTRKVKWIGRRGAPDRLVWIPGWKFPQLWELKAPGEDLEAHQKREHRKLTHMGITCRKIDNIQIAKRYLK